MSQARSNLNVSRWFDEYHDQLLRFLTRNLGDQTHAEDLAQEVFLRILRLEDAELIQHPRAYLFRVAVSVIQEWRLRDQRIPIQEDMDVDQIAGWESPAKDAVTSERDHRLNTAIASLPAMYRAVLQLRLKEGLRHREVADRLGISTRMVKRYLIKAYARLRDCLAEEIVTSPEDL